MVRPLGGAEIETTGILTALEPVAPAEFAPPDASAIGDDASARLLRDALRLGFRSSAGPFRCFGSLGVEPRPYQLVPLMMALKLDPVRLLIADDVGVGKTIEAALIARELLDQGDISRLAVLCPPHLAEQWRDELASKFHIEAELVLSSTARRLERDCRLDQTLFDLHPFTVVSTDFIKSETRRGEFVRTCPELVIVDEAHTCAEQAGQRVRHYRHELVARLAADPSRHMIFVTATPHSGNEEAFRSLLTLLSDEFEKLPEDISGPAHQADRRRLSAHFIQRQRGDIRRYLDADTTFPERDSGEESYNLSPEYRRLMDRVIAFARETVADASGTAFHQRVRWWSALALLRAVASSPAAAAATFRARAASADTETEAEADEVGGLAVLDLTSGEGDESLDVTPGADWESEKAQTSARRRLREMAGEADALHGKLDAKLVKAVGMLRDLVDAGYNPIVFCRFIDTAEYVAEEIRGRIKRDVTVAAVTGALPPEARQERVAELLEEPRRILVATDCLSEGVNLQAGFDAVIHYDLSWNPTRHEQRAGRVDRYGQRSPKVRVVTYYGRDNRIDGIVLQVLIRKHERIRTRTGISVPVPGDPNAVVEAIIEGLMLRGGRDTPAAEQLAFEEFLPPKEVELLRAWDVSAEREARSRSMFAQEVIKVDEVAREMREAADAVGRSSDVGAFLGSAIVALGGTVVVGKTTQVDLAGVPLALREQLGTAERFRITFDPDGPDGATYVTRTHPLIERLASYVLTTSLDALLDSPGRRCGAVRTASVERLTTLLLLRHRFTLVVKRGEEETPLLAEDCTLAAFQGSGAEVSWLSDDSAAALLDARPSGNLVPEQARGYAAHALSALGDLGPALEDESRRRAETLLAAHRRVREGAKLTGVRYAVRPHLPADVVGVYVFVPPL